METILAAAGNPNIKEELLAGKKVGNKTFRVHLDGYNLLPALKGETAWPRKEFMYWTDDGNVAALRFGDWKFSFLRQDAVGFDVWAEPFVELRIPMICNLRMDPFERAKDESGEYEKWSFEHAFVIGPAGAYVGQWLQSFREFPPRQKPGSFNLDRVMESVTNVPGNR
jgi:arylsulfatase